MFERVDSTSKPYRPSAGGETPPVHVMPEDVSVPVRKSTAPPTREFPAPPPQQADMKKIPGRKKMWIILSIVVGVLIIGIGGTFAAYRMGYIDIPFLNKIFLDEDVLARAAGKVLDIESGEIEISLAIAVEDKTDKAVVLKTSETDGYGQRQAAQAAQIKSDLSQYRTGLVLYYDDNLAYPDSLDDVVDDYLNSTLEPPNDQSTYTYKAGSDHKTFTLTATMKVGEETYTYSLDNEGNINDTFPKKKSSSLFDDEDFYDELIQGIPTDFFLEGRVYSFVGKEQGEKKQRDALMSVSGKYGSSGTTLELDFESRAKDGTTYIRVNKFPSFFFFDTGSITGQWIEAPSTEDLDDLGLGSLGLSDISDVAGGAASSPKEIRTLATYVIEKAISEGMISVNRKLPTERVDGKLYDKYVLSFNLNQLDETIISAQKKMNDYCNTNTCEVYDPDDFDEGDIVEAVGDIIGGENSLVTQLFDAGEYILWVDRDGDGYQLDMNLYLGLPEDAVKLSNKQVRLSMSISLDHINDEPNVERPKDAVDWDEAQRIMSGLTEDEWKYEQQIEAVNSLRTALREYYSTNDEFPESLSELLKPDAEGATGDSAIRVFKLAQISIDELPSFTLNDYYLLDELPQDEYSGKSFVYTKTEDNYELEYELKLDDKPSSSSSYYGYGSNQYADGKNTADKYVVSREAIWEKDSDSDGLSGKEEYEHGTDPTKRDTDFDGTSDFDEIQGGTDPLDPKSKPASAETQVDRRVYIPTIVAGSISPNTGNVNGGTIITLGYTDAKADAAVYLGSRRAYIKTRGTNSLTVVLPGYETPLTSGVSQSTTVKIVNNGRETTIGSFTYTGGILTDTDNDGLPDAEERAIGTSTVLEDSDQDGYSDYTEVNAGYDPLTPPSNIKVEKQSTTQMFNGESGSFEFWAKAPDWDANASITMVSFINDSEDMLVEIRKASSFLWFSMNGGVGKLDTSFSGADSSVWHDNEWTHIVVNWEKDENPSMFINGLARAFSSRVSDPSRIANTIVAQDISALTSIGNLYLQGNILEGDKGYVEIDGFTLYDKALTAAEVPNIYLQGR